MLLVDPAPAHPLPWPPRHRIRRTPAQPRSKWHWRAASATLILVALVCGGCGGEAAKEADALGQDRRAAWDALERGDADAALTLASDARQRARARLDDAGVAEAAYL